MMKKRVLFFSLLLGPFSQEVLAGNQINESVDDKYVEAGDALQFAIPLTGFFAAWLHDDAQGAKQLALSIAASQTIVQVSKQIVGRRRPNDSSNMSFPSGHSAAAFSGASFLQSRYGAAWGIPAYAGATFVAVSRMHGNRHHADDVLTGGAISFLMNQYLIAPYDKEGVTLSMAPTDGGLSLGVRISNEFFSKQAKPAYEKRVAALEGHRFELNVGFTLDDSLAKENVPSNTLIDEYQPFAAVNYTYQLNNNSQLEIDFAPNETRRRGESTTNFEFDGTSYFQGEDIYVAFRQWHLLTNYYRHFDVTDAVKMSVGAGLAAYFIETEIDLEDGGKYASDNAVKLLPNATVNVNVLLTKKLHLVGKVQYQLWDDDSVTSFEAGTLYDLNKEWDIGVKYLKQYSDWQSQSFDYESDSVILTIANRF